jgi:hypothetical protein
VKRTILATVLAVLLLPAAAHAAEVTTFQTVDEVKYEAYNLVITGIVDGEASARTIPFSLTGFEDTPWRIAIENCMRSATLAMNRPGRYRLSVFGGVSESFSACSLKRNK